MSELFLFTETLEENSALCTVIATDNAEPLVPLARRSFDEITTLAQNYPLTLIIPQIQCSLHKVELPWLSEKKARLAIPYALEEAITQPLETLHFAYSKEYYVNAHYLILTCERTVLQNILNKLHSAGIYPVRCTTDWFALAENALALTSEYILVNLENFKGVLPYNLMNFLPDIEGTDVFGFSETPVAEQSLTVTDTFKGSYEEWVAQELVKRKGINLLQGDFSQSKHAQHQTRLYKISALLGGLWILSILAVNGWQWYQYHQQNQHIAEKIEIIYRKFFPQATQVINPRFRIQRALKDSETTKQSTLWKLLFSITESLNDTKVIISSLQYRNNQLIINVKADSFDALEQLQNTLQQKNIRVRQSNATTIDQQISANLELTL